MTLSAFITKSLTTTLLGGSLFLTSATASAASPDGEHGAREGKQGGKICRVAQCDESQGERISAIRAATQKTVKAHKAAIKEGKKALAEAFRSDGFDAAEARRLEAEMDTHRDAIRAAKSDALVQMHGVLTPEQRNAVAEHMLERKGHGKGKKKGHAKGEKKGHDEGKRGPKGPRGPKGKKGPKADSSR